jgi:Trk K+ transport system NAD-binding subunit
MPTKRNVIIAGYSDFSWALAQQLKDNVGGRLYFVLSERERALEASLHEPLVVVQGEITDSAILDQLRLPECDTFIAGSGEDAPNVLAALYARKQGAAHVYACITDPDLRPLLRSLDVTPLQISQIAAAVLKETILSDDADEIPDVQL